MHHKAKSHLVELSSTLEWIYIHGMVKGAICDLFFSEQAVVDNNKYKMTWCIPYIVPQALSLVSTADYNLLIKKPLDENPNVKILVDKRAGNTVQNVWVVLIFSLTNHYPAACWKGECAWCCGTKPTCLYWAHTHTHTHTQKQKTKVCHAIQWYVLFLIPLNANARSARRPIHFQETSLSMNKSGSYMRDGNATWQCVLLKYATIPAEGPHFSLSFDHLKKWAAAIVCCP